MLFECTNIPIHLKINTKYIDKWKTELNLFDESQLAKAVQFFFTYFQDVSSDGFNIDYTIEYLLLMTLYTK